MELRLMASCGVIGCLLTTPLAAAPEAVYQMRGVAGQRFALEAAVEGAERRLARPDCQRVFGDFKDASGLTLEAKLVVLGRTPGEFLQELYFLDADDSERCMKRRAMAFTAPGLRVIRVCARRFASAYLVQPRYAESIVIHELLHALGLGENPPSSSDITANVLSRCR
jgi:hypothetical protein